MADSKPSSGHARLKTVLLKETGVDHRRQSPPTSAPDPASSETVEGWRTILYLQLRASGPGFNRQEAAQLAVDLSDAAFGSHMPRELALGAFRVLEGICGAQG